MGDIADLMIDGFLDCETGEVIDGDAPGFPRKQKDRKQRSMHACPYCEKLLKSEQGVQDHIAAKHAGHVRRAIQ